MLKDWKRRKQARAREEYSRGFGAVFSAVLLHGHDINLLEAQALGSGKAFDLGTIEGVRHLRRYSYLSKCHNGEGND